MLSYKYSLIGALIDPEESCDKVAAKAVKLKEGNVTKVAYVVSDMVRIIELTDVVDFLDEVELEAVPEPGSVILGCVMGKSEDNGEGVIVYVQIDADMMISVVAPSDYQGVLPSIIASEDCSEVEMENIDEGLLELLEL